MAIISSGKTNWFHLGVVVILTIIGFYVISQAMAKPFVEWQTFNEVRAAEMRSLMEE